jgi:hypothetical protein
MRDFQEQKSHFIGGGKSRKARVIESIPSKTSSSALWKEFHVELKDNYGKKQANAIFVKAWELRGGIDASANTNELRTYLEKQGITIDKNGLASIVDGITGAFDFFDDFLIAGKWIGIGLVSVVALGVGILVINIAMKPIEAANAAAKLRTGGMGGA